MSLSRRAFLRAKGAILSLPFLPSLAGVRDESAGRVKPSPKLIMMYVPNGLVRRCFFPGEEQTELPGFVGGFDADKIKKERRIPNRPGVYPLELTSTMQPLTEHAEDVTLVTGLDRTFKHGQDVHAQGASCYLTSLSPEQAEEQGIPHPNGRSLDQVIGDHVGRATVFNTLEISCNGFKAGKESIYFDNISWYGPDKIAPSIKDPQKLYDRLFMADSYRTHVSDVTDLVLADAKSLSRKLGQEDRKTLGEFMEMIRNIEVRIEKLKSLIADADIRIPKNEVLPRGEYIRLQADLMLLALQMGITNVCTFMVGPERWDASLMYEGVFRQAGPASQHDAQPARRWLQRLAEDRRLPHATVRLSAFPHENDQGGGRQLAAGQLPGHLRRGLGRRSNASILRSTADRSRQGPGANQARTIHSMQERYVELQHVAYSGAVDGSGNRSVCGQHGCDLGPVAIGGEASMLAIGLWCRRWVIVLTLGMLGASPNALANEHEFERFFRPLVAERCAHCHAEAEASGGVDLQQINTVEQWLSRPPLIKQMMDVIDANDMPPEGEPSLSDQERRKMLAMLKDMLRQATAGQPPSRLPLRRLNRLQYNNSVRDLFQLKLDVFQLPEKLMTRRDAYLDASQVRMPDRVHVVSHSLSPQAGLRGVVAFPKDLRAAHGFDNQANQLTLSPLLLDAFLRLSVSIVESPDFNKDNVGVWQEMFQAPGAGDEVRSEIERRLRRFLSAAFRGPVAQQTLGRYTNYVAARIEGGETFTDSMKKAASAALSSPLFLYRAGCSADADDADQQLVLASNLSFFLWNSGPDPALLELAENGALSEPAVLQRVVDRMLADPKIERFLDAFPSQWLQLENVLAATPDPQRYRFFSIDQEAPASLQMILEPLLLFDAVFVENRPIGELLAPPFNYQSEFLKTWYESDLQPPQIDVAAVRRRNLANEKSRQELRTAIEATRQDLELLLQPVRAELLSARKQSDAGQAPVDLKPYAAWEFNGDLTESIRSLDLTAHGDIRFEEEAVFLQQAYLLSSSLPIALQAKSLEVWCMIHDLDQSGGGVMGIQGPGDFFDTIVLGERQARHWISGSNGFSRTHDFPESTPEDAVNQLLHLVMVYQEDGTTSMYRNGRPYGKPFRKDRATFPKDQTSVIFGLRHLPPGGNKYLTVSLHQARLYDRALTADEVAASHSSNGSYVADADLWRALTEQQKTKKAALDERSVRLTKALNEIPPADNPVQMQQDLEREYGDELRRQLRSPVFHRVAAADPRYGGVITNAAMLSMTSGPTRTHPIARGAWIIEVILNNPPAPPPNDVPPLQEDGVDDNLTIRERFAAHRENPDCAACHARLDPLGFALENYDITGRWRDKYENGRAVDPSGILMRKHEFDGVVQFKEALLKEQRRFAKAFVEHLLRFALSRELTPADALSVDAVLAETQPDDFQLKSLIKGVVFSDSFLQQPR